MTPFEIILSILAYIALGNFIFRDEAPAFDSPGQYTLATLLWPLIVIIRLFIWRL